MSKKKTHEEYVIELSIKNPMVEVVGKYINANTKIEHLCLIHNELWETTPSRALQGVGCNKCKKEKFRDSRIKTHEQYVEEVLNINPLIEVIEEYVDAKTPIKHYCFIHDVYWDTCPNNILKRCGCPECGKEKIGLKNSKTYEQYVQEFNLKNRNIQLDGEYKNSSTPTMYKCLIDNHKWKARPIDILRGQGCPMCASNIKKTTEKYIQELRQINNDIDVLEEYTNINTPILHLCKIHNVKWKSSPRSVLQGCGCPECGKEKISNALRKSHEQYLKELNEINPNIIPLEIYSGANTHILHKCLIDETEWNTTPSHTLQGYGCPICNASKGEKTIKLWLENHNILYESQKRFADCRDKNTLPFDFYLQDYNLCIEYQGEQHYHPIEYFGGQEYFEYIQKHDEIKAEYCKNNNINLFYISYNEDIEEKLNNFLFI